MSTTNQQLSNDGGRGPSNVMQEFNLRKKIASRVNRLRFLRDCIAEQVLPTSTPSQLKQGNRPFTTSAKAYLEESCKSLKDKLNILLDERRGIRLPQELETKLRKTNEEQQSSLRRKLQDLCTKSPWREAGNVHIVTNLSSRMLSNTEKEALSLGLKFDCGKVKTPFIDNITRNYKWDKSDIEKGFIQGVLTCCQAMANEEESNMPRRYFQALKTLADDQSIVITPADKGGGVVIIDKSEYDQKMRELLDNKDVYRKKPKGHVEKSSKCFNKRVRSILKKSEKGKELLHLIEEAPAAPRMRGVPKIHKINRPMRPITSGIGSAPHRLAKILAKPLSRALDSISGCHIRNTADMMDRLKDVNFSNKKLASLDVKSLYTNVPVDAALNAIRAVVQSMDERALPIPKAAYLDAVRLCMHFNAFTFQGEEYSQHSGLAMGSPLSPVAACLFMETLEEEHFKEIMGTKTTWMRYVDDILLVIPENMNLESKLQELNAVHPNIQFSAEKEKEGGLAFLDTYIIREGQTVKYKVYRKPTNKEDYIHYFSGHHERYKRGIVIGFFLRAYRICSEEYLDEELKHIFKRFSALKYPQGLLVHLKKKAKEIIERPRTKKPTETKTKPITHITVPNFKSVDTLVNYLQKAGVKITIATGRKTRDILGNKCSERSENSKSVVYKIPCGGCNKAYIGETGRGLKTRIHEHKRDVRDHNLSNAIVVHAEKSSHLPQWEKASILEKGMSKPHRKALEAAHILTEDNKINTRAGFFSLPNEVARLAVQKR